MAMKRKRSSPGFSPASSEATYSSDASSPQPLPFFYAQSKPVEPLYAKLTWSFPTYESDETRDSHPYNHVSSRHLNSRTRKRHRDDRPDEKSIFATTLSRLYDAQRNHPHAEPVSSYPTTNTRPEGQPQRSTLHSFWNIGSSVPMTIDSGPSSVTSLETRCEDCEGSLRAPSAMDVDDGLLEQDTTCASCRRHVCDGCAVLGNERVCLGCASRSGS